MGNHVRFLLILLFSFIQPLYSGQPYDHTPCNTTAPTLHGSTYTCNSDINTYNTYVIYRPQLNQQLSEIARLFNVNDSELQQTTHLQDREVVVPIICDCPDWSSRALNGNLHETTVVKVPIKCACVSTSLVTNGITYLVSYPLMESDTIDIVARKFGVTPESILEANELDPHQTIFGGTTLLVPTTGVPVLNLDYVVDGPSSHEYTIPVIVNHSMGNRFSTFLIVFATICLCGVILLLVFLKWKYRHQEPQVVAITGLEFKRLSPDFLVGVSKLKQSLTSFSLDEVKLATQNFSESLLIGKSVYKGQMTGGFPVTIEDMKSIESANHVISILTTINHFNVVRLEGCCFHMNRCYLVFEFVKNGSLRECLHDAKTRKQLTWAKRVKLAFDIAEGLHYIHYCTKPTYAHHNISSGNILITTDWRAKISGFNLAKPIVYNVVAEGDGGDSAKYLECGKDSTKVDVYAYGAVLLELLSAKEAVVGRKWLDRVEFLADVEVVGGSSECLEKFKMFMDVHLEGEYALGDALCLALLAKCCIHDDPEIRPTMNDVLKALSRIS
ncbi:protein LYK5-like [Bidens hawaiensis]|uniref:protein LYK5-like n=1 Tax=Bidens hawaiensis TaxID=980011 RepID=UPI00404A7788